MQAASSRTTVSSGKRQLRSLTISTSQHTAHVAAITHTQAPSMPAALRPQQTRPAAANTGVNLKMLLAAPSGQTYLHQNIRTTNDPRKSSTTDTAAIHGTISPRKPVAIA